ncbi:MAG: hypothetical protein PHH28_12965 [Desulfuromonadaceae bacterium]|nr:hypothetical protein [Desulfuromonadaceae bacterium]
MALLTRRSITRISDVLDKSCFTSAAFELVTPDAGDYLASIKFFDRPDYEFNIRSVNSGFTVQYMPGNVVNSVYVKQDTFDICLTSLHEWTNNIKAELLSSNPLFNEFEELKKTLNDAIDQKYSTSYESFTKEELNTLKNDFELLNSRFSELHEKSVITDQELTKIKKTMDELLAEANSFPKKVWYRTYGNNMLKLLTNTISSPTGQKILEEGARKLLDIPPSS